MLFDSLDEEIDLSYIKKMHLIIGKMTVINAGSLRLDEVRIAGSSYIPPIPDAAYDDEMRRSGKSFLRRRGGQKRRWNCLLF